MTLFVILILSHNKKGVDISMRKDFEVKKSKSVEFIMEYDFFLF